jgi:hypothetical protein
LALLYHQKYFYLGEDCVYFLISLLPPWWPVTHQKFLIQGLLSTTSEKETLDGVSTIDVSIHFGFILCGTNGHPMVFSLAKREGREKNKNIGAVYDI